jgi:hypothetical protein
MSCTCPRMAIHLDGLQCEPTRRSIQAYLWLYFVPYLLYSNGFQEQGTGDEGCMVQRKSIVVSVFVVQEHS